jgi:hypothetical protein
VGLLERLLKYFNDNLSNHSKLNLVTNLYVNFIRIHPFEDGNGRLSRAIFDGLLNDEEILNISLYRLNRAESSWYEFTKSDNNLIFDYHEKKFFSEFIDWNSKLYCQLNKKIKEDKKIFLSHFQFYNLSFLSSNFLEFIWENPILNYGHIMEEFGNDGLKITKYLKEKGLAEDQIDRKNNSLLISCNAALEHWSSIDKALIK